MRILMGILGGLLVTGVARSSMANERPGPGDHALTVVSRADGSAQPYRLFVPKTAREGKPMSLLVVLHGKGVDHNAWFDLTPVKDVADRYGYIVAAPNGRGDRYYDGPGEQDVLDVIDDVARRCAVDADRVYLTGHSMGGWGTWFLGLRHPDRFAAIAPMAGLAPQPERLPNARHLAPFIIHDTDDDVVPVSQSRGPAGRLAELGISFQYREESGFGHRSALIGANLPRLLEWFNVHPRVQRPDRVTLVAAAGDPSRAYWITAMKPAGEKAPGSVDARLKPGGRMIIDVDSVRQIEIDLDALPTDAPPTLEIVVNGQSVTRAERRGSMVLQSADGESWQCAAVPKANQAGFVSPEGQSHVAP